MKSIKKEAKKFIKEIKCEVSFDAIKCYLNSCGYEVLFYNSDEQGDNSLKEYKLYDYALTKMAFTVRKNKRKTIFINACNQNKLCSLIHEAAHMVLNHMLEDKHIANERLHELEAESFTHYVLNYKKPTLTLPSVACIILAVALVFAGIVSAYNTAVPDNAVYVTQSGKKYHRENCMYVESRNCSALTIEEARKEYEPCEVCNP